MNLKNRDWLQKSNLTWLTRGTIYLTLSGSRAYGMSTPQSDIDIKGVAIPPLQYFLGYLHHFKQAEFKEPYDAVIYDIRKFCDLASACNPNIVEMLFVEPDQQLYVSPEMERLLDHRHLFVSRKAKWTFSGYAMSQLKRIKTHRQWLLYPQKEQPTRTHYGLPEGRSLIPKAQLNQIEALVQRKLDSWKLDIDLPSVERKQLMAQVESTLVEMKLGTKAEVWEASARSCGLAGDLLEMAKKEKAFHSAMRDWKRFQEWKLNRNPERALMEAESGYDRKHAAHLVRLLRMGEEILRKGSVNVKRPDADELLSIRRGAWSYDQLIEWAEQQERVLDVLYEESPLPKAPDRKAIDKLCVDMVQQHLGA